MVHQGHFLCECFITNVEDMVFYSCVNQFMASYIPIYDGSDRGTLVSIINKQIYLRNQT